MQRIIILKKNDIYLIVKSLYVQSNSVQLRVVLIYNKKNKHAKKEIKYVTSSNVSVGLFILRDAFKSEKISKGIFFYNTI